MDFSAIYNEIVKLVVLALPHWPFFMYMFIFAFLGEISKRYVFNERNIANMEKKGTKLWNMNTKVSRLKASFYLLAARMPFELHPVLAGTFLAMIPGLPLSEGVMYGIQACLYIACAGMASLALYAVLRGIWKLFWVYVLKSEDPVPDIHFPGEADDESAGPKEV